MPITVRIKALDPSLAIPAYAYAGDAAFDLCAREDTTFAPGEYKGVPTGIALAIPEGYVGLVWDKSSVGIKQGMKTLGGVIDCGYRGEVMVGLANLSGEPRAFKKGEKVAQMVIQKKETVLFETTHELDSTERGDRGFGSSGK